MLRLRSGRTRRRIPKRSLERLSRYSTSVSVTAFVKADSGRPGSDNAWKLIDCPRRAGCVEVAVERARAAGDVEDVHHGRVARVDAGAPVAQPPVATQGIDEARVGNGAGPWTT